MRVIAGLYKNRAILAPEVAGTRPTASRLRESLFNICQSYIAGATFLDLFAGSGAMGLEALSRGAASATFVELERPVAKMIRRNLEHFGAEKQGEVIDGDVFAVLQRFSKTGRSFDIIYADPPYQQLTNQGVSWSREILNKVAESSLLKPGGMLFIEEAESLHEDLQKAMVALNFIGVRRAGKALLWQYQRPEG